METIDSSEISKDEIKPSLSGAVLFPSENRMSHIKNKQVRIKKYQKAKHELKKVRFRFIPLFFSVLYILFPKYDILN